MNSRRETAAAHRPGRDAQRVLPTAPPSQREAEISHRLRSSRSESHLNLPLADFDQPISRSRILMIWVCFVRAPLDRRGAARRPVDGPVFPSWAICRGILGGTTRPNGGVLAPPRGGGR